MRGPFAIVTRDAHLPLHNTEFAEDANAAYQNAIMWTITRDLSHAQKAMRILDGWAGSLKTIDGHDARLAASLYGFKYVSAAELMRHTDSGWPTDKASAFDEMAGRVILPLTRDFAPDANGNWGAACIKTTLAIAVFRDDAELFNRAVRFYCEGHGDACLANYVFNSSGQCQESGRDQQHTQLGLGQLAESCEIAWNQGLDLYGAYDNRLLHGFEYTARYNLGLDVPFIPHTDVTGHYKAQVISTIGRNELRPIYEMVLNHYSNRRGLSAPFTQRAAEKLRPEGPGFGADHVGFGTLLFTEFAMPSTHPSPASVP